MEAATPLRQPHLRLIGDRVVVEGLLVDDETAVRLVRERQEAGGDGVELLLGAIEIGARVLDREQTGANVELAKVELERAARELETTFGEGARTLSEQLSGQLEQVFGAESGHLTKALERHFSDGSSDAVQHRVKSLVTEVMAQAREDLLRQFSSTEGHNPLADFKQGTLAVLRQASEQQDKHLTGLHEKLSGLELELAKLHSERDKQFELASERDRGTAKGRDYEEAVFEALDAIASVQGDDCDAVGDTKGATRKTGDIVVGIEACRGPARGRVVFEAKDRKLSKPEAMRELDRGRGERDADYAVLVVSGEDKMPAKTQALREYNGDKLIAVYDPQDGATLALELAYRLARARTLMARGGNEGIDLAAVSETVERALGAMDDVRSIRQKLTGATTSIADADALLGTMADTVRAHLARIDELLAAAPPSIDA
ncbi:MAG: DUF2130 domain-containing protein [Actinomycetota bacterium]|nr:DUF2130 domain-containing protein [Actinomycetota bacterium]